MEAAASVFTLLHASAIFVSAARELSRKLREAPEELHALTVQLLVVQSELKRIRQASDGTHSGLLSNELGQGMKAAFIEARTGLSELDGIIDRARFHLQMKDKSRWLRKSHKSAETALSKIRSAREGLLILFQVMS